MAGASDHIWALVSGLPQGKRGRRLFMVIQFDPFQAWADDSGSDPQSEHFVLAGFIARAGAWASFSSEWQAALGLPPKLDYFKASEAYNLSGQFAVSRGWNAAARDDRITILTRIINKHAAVRIYASIKHSHFAKYIGCLPAVERNLTVDHPYVFLAQRLILWTAVRSDIVGIREPTDFFFDEQLGFSAEFARKWEAFKALVHSRPSNLKNFLGSEPIYRDDKTFLPLQAADLYAWHVRRFLMNSERRIIIPPSPTLRQLLHIKAINTEIKEPELIRLHDHLVNVGKQVRVQNPALILIPPSKSARKRTRATTQLNYCQLKELLIRSDHGLR